MVHVLHVAHVLHVVHVHAVHVVRALREGHALPVRCRRTVLYFLGVACAHAVGVLHVLVQDVRYR